MKKALKDYYKTKRQKADYTARNRYWHNEFRKNIARESTLTAVEKDKIKEFYGKYVKKIDYVYHEFYKQKTGKFDLYCIPDNIYYNYIDHFYNDWDLATKIDNKCYYDYYFSQFNLPESVFYRINNIWFNEKRKPIQYAEVLKRASKKRKIFVKKATESEGGHGVYYLERGSDLQKVIDEIDCDIVIQEEIKQSKKLSRLNPSSVNTVRILTLLRDDKVEILSCIVRMGNKGSKVDNASSGGVTCGIRDDGRLKENAYTSSGIKYREHPYTKVVFSDVVIPNFDKAKAMAKIGATLLPHFRLVSWDIAFDTNDQPLLIEANLHYGELDFHQLNNGPIFGKKTKEILEEVFRSGR